MTRPRRRYLILFLAIALVGAGIAAWAVRRAPRRPLPPSPRLAELRQTHERLHHELEELAGRDPLLAEIERDQGQVVVGLRASLVKGLLNEIAARYLDKVVLDLAPDVQVRKSGEVKVMGAFKAGSWKVALSIDRLQGVLRAGPPKVALAGTHRVRLSLPVVIEEGRGSAIVRFSWDSRSLANVLCRDFEITRRIVGKVLPDDYIVDGAFVLSTGSSTLTAQPVFPERRFRVRADLVSSSWADVREAFESQDKIDKCGIGVDPDDLVNRLRELGENGFDVKLPRRLFRTVEFPASVRQSVSYEGYRLDLSVRTNDVRVTKDAFWYSASVHTRLRPPRPTAGSPAAARPPAIPGTHR